MGLTYDRAELQRLIAMRHGQFEGMGDGAFIEFRIRVTPELLEQMLGGTWTNADGDGSKRTRLQSVYVNDDGTIEPIFEAEVPA